MMKELHTFGWYAARISPFMPKEAFQAVPSRLLGGFAYLLVIAIAITSIAIFHLPMVLTIGISVVIGFSFAAMGFLGHEILHGTVVRRAWLRDLLGGVFFWPLCTGPKLWRKWHNMEHHIHTQDETKDPDAWPSLDQVSNKWVIKLVYRLPLTVRSFFSFLFLTFSFSVHSFNMFLLYVKEFNSKNRSKVIFQLIFPWATWIGLLILLGPLKWFFAFLLPLLIANVIVMGYISTNHRLNPLVDVNDPLANCLTVTVPKWMDVLHFNFSYHTEHHLFPGMNPKYYPTVKKIILQQWPERYHQMSLARALITLWKTPRVYYNKSELFDPKKEHLFQTLGNGLNPREINSRDMKS